MSQTTVDQCPCVGPVSTTPIIYPVFLCAGPDTFSLTTTGPTTKVTTSGAYTTMRRATGPNTGVLYTYLNSSPTLLPPGTYCGWSSDVDGNVVAATLLTINGDVFASPVASIDVSRMTHVVTFVIQGLRLTALDIDDLTALKNLTVGNVPGITALSTTYNVLLETASIIGVSNLAAMDLSTNVALKSFIGINLSMTTPDFTNNVNLTLLRLSNGVNMVTPVLTTNVLLYSLILSGLPLVSAVDTSQNVLLGSVNYDSMVNLTSAPTTLNTALVSYAASNCPLLPTPDLHLNVGLANILIISCPLVDTIDTSLFPLLITLTLKMLTLTTPINISANTALKTLVIYSVTGVSSVSTTGLTNLRTVDILNMPFSVGTVNAILVNADANGLSSGTMKLLGTGMSAPGPTGLVAAENLANKLWTVNTL